MLWWNNAVRYVDYVNSEDNVADIFTKALGRVKFEKLREPLGVVPLLHEDQW